MVRAPTDKPAAKPSEKRSFRTRPVREVVAALTKGAFRKQGFTQTEILTRWPAIVGETLAEVTAPERLQFHKGGGATLVVRTEGSFAPELQHLTPLVVERVNTHFGYRAVTKLAIVQGPLPHLAERRTPSAGVDDHRPAPEIAEAIAATRDPNLASALAALARAMRRP
ncbi:MAG: DUF721 domain-containing protein [Alphaproteobacteria bacterium]|nr:DUF721 domain-containing protein [Alphaproteobacteria bacterium]